MLTALLIASLTIALAVIFVLVVNLVTSPDTIADLERQLKDMTTSRDLVRARSDENAEAANAYREITRLLPPKKSTRAKTASSKKAK